MSRALTVTPRTVRLFSLTRQNLVQPQKVPQAAAHRLIAIQAQYEGTAPVAVWSRCSAVRTGWVDDALRRARTLVKTWCLRGTVHIIASGDLALIAQSVGPSQLADYFHFMETRRGLRRGDLEPINKRILEALASGPLSRSELHAAVPALAEIQGASWGLDVKGLAFTGEILFVDSDGRESRFARRDLWLSDVPWNPPEEAAALRELLRRYLAAYGPATMQDFAHWSGLKMDRVRATFEGSQDNLVPVTVMGWAGLHYALVEDEPELQGQGWRSPELCLLPKFDPLLMAYANKLRYMDAEDMGRVFRPAGQVEGIVLTRGEARATWRLAKRGASATVHVELFRKLGKALHAAMTDAFESLAEYLNLNQLRVSVAEG